jgi:hypothetical protein
MAGRYGEGLQSMNGVLTAAAKVSTRRARTVYALRFMHPRNIHMSLSSLARLVGGIQTS